MIPSTVTKPGKGNEADLPVASSAAPKRPRWFRAGNGVQRAAAVLLAVLVLFALAGPVAWPDHAIQDLSRFLEAPSLAEPLGRDHLGRSVIARLAHATQLSLLMAVLCVATALLL